MVLNVIAALAVPAKSLATARTIGAGHTIVVDVTAKPSLLVEGSFRYESPSDQRRSGFGGVLTVR
jgi:hypothetical protein